MSDIQLVLNSYEDIFSDFDPRNYADRALSVDFLDEIKRASREKTDGITLTLLLPKRVRDVKKEPNIQKRLKEHFRKHFHELDKDRRRLIRRGIISTVAGVAVMFGAAYLLFQKTESTLLGSFLIILLEPAGWFLFWEGLNQVIYETERLRANFEFYEKLHRAKVVFLSY